MLPRSHPDGIHIAFDDHRLVNNAGLILPATLGRHLGLSQLVDWHLDLGRHQPICVATSRRPHPILFESGQARSSSLIHHPLCQRQGPSFRWIRDKVESGRTNLSRQPDYSREKLCRD